jgi:peptidoglycan hydrolase CwlO-like protein
MKHPNVILSLEAELSGIEIEVQNLKNDLSNPLQKVRDIQPTKIKIENCKHLIKEYKSAIRALTLLDGISFDNSN